MRDQAGRIVKACEELNVAGNIILPTSGTTGSSRWVVLSRDALKGSARSVNAHLEIGSDDIWICALPVFHTGGLAVHVRGAESGSEVVSYSAGWSAQDFAKHCHECRATLCSLVPTQLFDLVAQSIHSPPSLRILLIGGAALNHHLRDQAIALGWPIHETYGMTEAGSQVATQRTVETGIEILNCWNARLDNNSILEIRGDNLFSGYLLEAAGAWSFVAPINEEGWFSTGDRMRLSGRMLKALGRGDSMIKVLGEKVELDALQARVESIAGTASGVAAVTDERCGYKLILVFERGVDAVDILNRFNSMSTGPERLSEIFPLKEIPRNSLGKVRRKELNGMINALRERTT
ncbi:MAG: AMP-binding protein [Verrucomicrobiaceae bacterium]|nr:AMP-binding protein [Verrucomicrobiaceae bacterium]